MDHGNRKCQQCSQKRGKFFCYDCAVLICRNCKSSSHQTHRCKAKSGNKDHDRNIGILVQKLSELKANDTFLKNAINDLSSEAQRLTNKKEEALNQIDKFALHVKKMTQEYTDQFKELALKSMATSDMNSVPKKRKINNEVSSSNNVSELEVDFKIDSDNTNVENITETPNENSADFMNLQANKMNDNRIINEEIISGSNDFNKEMETDDLDDLEYIPLLDCSCCNQWAVKLIQCNYCKRHYHPECHIPKLPKDMNVCESSQTKWKCTLCRDIGKYCKVLNQRDLDGEMPVGEIEHIIMQRILMEIYCQNCDSEHYRQLPSEELYPAYYQRVPFPLALNDIKRTFESDEPYTSFIQFILDLKHVFSNGLMYYSPCDPYYRSAVNLQVYLERLINKWIPKLRNDNRLQLN